MSTSAAANSCVCVYRATDGLRMSAIQNFAAHFGASARDPIVAPSIARYSNPEPGKVWNVKVFFLQFFCFAVPQLFRPRRSCIYLTGVLGFFFLTGFGYQVN